MNLMHFVEMLEWEKVRQLCIDYELFTRGNNEQYSDMLQKCTGNPREVIPVIVPLILKYSETDMDEVGLASAIYNRCCVRWAEEG